MSVEEFIEAVLKEAPKLPFKNVSAEERLKGLPAEEILLGLPRPEKARLLRLLQEDPHATPRRGPRRRAARPKR